MHAILSNPLFAPIVTTLVIIAAFPLVAGYLTLTSAKCSPISRCVWDPCALARTASCNHRRRSQASAQGRHHPDRFGPMAVLVRALHLHHHRARCVFGASLRQEHRRGGRKRWPADRLFHVERRDPRDYPRRMGLEQPLLAAGLAAQRRPACELRSGAGFALVSGVMAAGTLSMQGIVRSQLENGVWGASPTSGS